MKKLSTLIICLLFPLNVWAAVLPGWSYRNALSISGSIDGDQTNYQMRLTVYSGSGVNTQSSVYMGGKGKNDFSDLRFTDSDGITLLNYSIVSKTDGDRATVDVKIPTILSATGATAYLYYGNSAATTNSSGAATYPLFQDNERDYGVVLPNAATRLTLDDTQGGYQLAHPSVIKFATNWNGHKYWMANTPYPASDSAYENPVVYYADNETTWTPIAGNPIIGKPTAAGAYNADTELVYNDSTNELWIYYKRYSGDVFGCYAIKSTDGVSWTDLDGGALNADSNPGTLVVDLSGGEEVSYSVIKTGPTTWTMWSFKQSDSSVRRRTSADGRSWSAPTNCTFKNREGVTKTFAPWHFQVKYIPEKNTYVGMFNTGISTGGHYALLADSTDGLTYTVYPTRLLSPASGSWDASDIYRPSFIYDSSDNKIKVWYSAVDLQGASPDVWGTGYTEMVYETFYAKAVDLDGWDEDFYAGLIGSGIRSSMAQSRTGSMSGLTEGEFDLFRPTNISGKLKVNVSFYDDGTTARETLLQIKNDTTANFGIGWFGTTNIITYNNGAQDVIAARSAGWHDFEIRFNGSAVSVYLDNVFKANYTAAMSTHTTAKIYSFNSGQTYIDDLYIRNYTPNEPTISEIGAVEPLAAASISRPAGFGFTFGFTW